MGSRARRPLLAALAVVAAALAVTGCVSIPNAGPVLSYPVTEQTGCQNGQNLQFTAQLPGAGWTPQQIVSGFLIATAANQDQAARARELGWLVAERMSHHLAPLTHSALVAESLHELLGPLRP